MRNLLLVVAGPVLAASLWLVALTTPARDTETQKDAFAYNRLLSHGINLGNALEAPQEGAWGLTLKAEYFQKIKQAGFDSVRLPIRWSSHAGDQAPHEIDATFFKRVDWAIEQALSQKLAVVINVHHYEEMYRAPDKHLPRLLALWQQIGQRYAKRSDRLFFEVLNEPHDKLTEDRWAKMLPQLLGVLRKSNPQRAILVGPGQWNNLEQLDKLKLPKEDRLLIVTFHYYSPFEFTHQGAEWVAGSKKWQGQTWKGTPQQREALAKDFAKAAAWAKKNQRPLYLGEFGSYSKADLGSRALWTRAVAREAEKHGMSWAYWEFAAGFGVYDRTAGAWRQPLLKALLSKEP
jgi:endoglucanase